MYHLYIHKLLYYYVLGPFLNSVSVREKGNSNCIMVLFALKFLEPWAGW
jgi:hypothetical protein